MKLKVKLNKDIAFSSYLRNVINATHWPWLRKEFEGKIPLSLLNKAKIFSDPLTLRFSFEKHPLKDFEKYNSDFKDLAKRIEKVHNQEWRKYYKDLKEGEKNLKELIDKYGNFIIKTIPTITKNKWRFLEIWFIPVIYRGGTIFANKVLVGCNKRPKEKILSLLIHELFHVNEPPKEKVKRFTRDFKMPRDSREIATVLMTNKLIEKLNKKFKVNIPLQGFHDYFRKMIAKFKPELRKLAESKKSYIPLIKAVDDFLAKKGYRGYYSRYIR